MESVHISAKADYAVRAAIELAAAGEGPVKGEAVALAQGIPQKYLETILNDMRRGGLVFSQRGADGGYWLSRPASEITVAEVIRVVDGPLAWVRGQRPENVEYDGSAVALKDVWIAVRANLRAVLDRVTLEDLASKRLPDDVREIVAKPEAWALPRSPAAGGRPRPQTEGSTEGAAQA
jgi:Rrf2 family protein